MRRTSPRHTEGKRELKTRGDGVRVPRRVHPTHIPAEFDFSATPEAPHALPSAFSSPPLSSGLLQSVHDVLGPNAHPTPIQSLSLKHLFVTPSLDSYRRFLLASETGSGKSLAYLLPMLHDLKTAEHLSLRRTGPRASASELWEGACPPLQTPRAERITRERCECSGVSREDGSCFRRR